MDSTYIWQQVAIPLVIGLITATYQAYLEYSLSRKKRRKMGGPNTVEQFTEEKYLVNGNEYSEPIRLPYFYFSFTDRPANRYLSNFFLKNLPWPHILYDTMQSDTWVFSDSWFSNIPTAHRWYKKGVNYAAMDGSVQMVKESPRREFK